MKSFFLLLICLAAGFEQKELPLKTYIAPDDSISADDIMQEQFKPCEYVNVFSEKGTVWLETDLPGNSSSYNQEVLYFTPELFFTAEVFFKDSTGRWLFIGRTGSGVPHQKKSLGARYNAVSLIPIIKKHASEHYDFSYNSAPPVTLRIRITASRPAPITAFVMSLNKFTLAGEFVTFYLAAALSACIIALIYVIFNTLLFKERGSIFFAIICGLLALHIFIANGIFFGRLLNVPLLNHYLYKFNYIIICLITICGIIILQKMNFPVKHNFSKTAQLVSDIIPILNMAVISLGILYFILNVPDKSGIPIIFSAMLIALIIFTVQMNFTLLYNPAVRYKVCISMLIAVYMLVIQQFFHLLRFVCNYSCIFRLFDYDLDLPEFISIILIGTASLMYIQGRIKNKLAFLQLSTESVKIKTAASSKLSYVYSNLSQLLINPIQLLSTAFIRIAKNLDSETSMFMKESIGFSQEIINALHLLAYYENASHKPDVNNEPINLHDFILEAMKNPVSNFQLNDCISDIRETFPPDTLVAADKALMSVLLKFVLQAALKQVSPGTPVLVSIDYVNHMFIYSVHFYSDPILHSDLKRILDLQGLEPESNENDGEEFKSTIEKWGIYLYVVRKILKLFNGNIQIIPDSLGNTITLRIAVPPVDFNSDGFRHFIESGAGNPAGRHEKVSGNNTDVIESTTPLYSETVYILEENALMRDVLAKEFRPFFRTVLFSTGTSFYDEIDSVKADVILCSNTLPGKSALEILKEKDKFGNIPFMITANFISPKNITQLLQMGATDIIQKPFNIDHMLLRISNIMNEKRQNSLSAIENINKILKQEIFSKDDDAELSDTAEKKSGHVQKRHDKKQSIETRAQTAWFTSAGLTKKEIMIAKHIAEGKTDKEIAIELDIAPGTVAVHNKRIFKKLNIHRRNELSARKKQDAPAKD